MLICAIYVGIFDWDLCLHAKNDGSLGLEGLKYDPKDVIAGGAGSGGGGSPRAEGGDDNNDRGAQVCTIVLVYISVIIM
jgi:hypothetical protein